MRRIYLSEIAFAHAVRYNDLLLTSWAKRTGRAAKGGGFSYQPEDVPPYIDLPTNDDRSRAEVIEFKIRPIQPGQSYTAYLSGVVHPRDIAASVNIGVPKPIAVITTWTGEPLAFVTRITSNRVSGHLTDVRGSFLAIGIDRRQYHGRHNGQGIYCRMRLSSQIKRSR